MRSPPYRALRILLIGFSFLLAAAGLLVIFSGKPLMVRMFIYPPASDSPTFFSS